MNRTTMRDNSSNSVEPTGDVRTAATRRVAPFIGVLFLAMVVPVVANAAKVTVPGSPSVASISSIRKSATIFNLKVTVNLPRNTGGASIIATVVTAAGKSCTMARSARTCSIANVPKGARVTVIATSRNVRGFGAASSPVRYVVGSTKWTRPAATVPSTTTPSTTTSVPGARPYQVVVPSSYSSSTPAPLVVLLHGYGASGAIQSTYMGFDALAEQRGFLLVHPDGTLDASGSRFWNATDACCNFSSPKIDDETYLVSILDKVSADYAVDQKRIYFVGHSNGGFMAYRMACNRSGRIAAVAVLAGAMVDTASACTPSHPVSVLHVHGTLDQTILYNGGELFGNAYPGAATSVGRWVTSNGCTGAPTTSPSALDLVTNLPGNDTTVKTWSSCNSGTEVALWTVTDGVHVPSIASDFSSRLVDFLFAHPKP